jgi:hypothetical protein
MNKADPELIEIRCPQLTTLKSGRKISCNRMLVEVASGSRGRAWCKDHGLVEFDTQTASGFETELVENQHKHLDVQPA